ncbi:hypothetical protein ACTVCO_09525 [Sanguibacter sp. A247]|uniref:hypothetical protein n=1 Tax=unclassified Sanguibacter TaxID=2645534 RepID=UPI003FD7826C
MWTWLFRHLPGPTLVRVLVVVLAMAALVAVLFVWVFPWTVEQWPGLVGRPDVAASAHGPTALRAPHA